MWVLDGVGEKHTAEKHTAPLFSLLSVHPNYASHALVHPNYVLRGFLARNLDEPTWWVRNLDKLAGSLPLRLTQTTDSCKRAFRFLLQSAVLCKAGSLPFAANYRKVEGLDPSRRPALYTNLLFAANDRRATR